MFILYLENYPPALRGKLKTYLYEVKPALYIGTTSALTRDLIWNQMILPEPNINAVLVYPDAGEQGFSVKTIGETKRRIENVGGLLTISKGEVLNIDLLKAKSSSKSLICHFHETAITAKMLLNGYFNDLIKRIGEIEGLDADNLKNIIIFFSFLHDIGKIHPAFQYTLISDILDAFGYEYESNYKGFRHESYSETILNDWIKQKFEDIPSRDVVSIMPKVIACHHQGKEKQQNKACLPVEWKNMQTQVLDMAWSLFPFTSPKKVLKQNRNGIFEIILGIVNISDWIASTQNVYDEQQPDNFDSIVSYHNHLARQCETFLNTNMLNPIPIHSRFHDTKDYWSILLNGFTPRPMQSAVEIMIVKEQQPSLIFIEDACGGGKTEAALYYALMATPQANGIYFALPTTATSDNMRQRVSEICKNISPNFKVPVYNSMAWMQEDDVKLDTNLWENNSKLKLFYPIAVGTVDQLLMSIQAVPYSDLGLVSLCNKTLIIDEMHAYDAYMLQELKLLFSYCALMGVTIIVLSATMTDETKKQLIQAYNRAQETETVEINNVTTRYCDLNLKRNYPLITKVTQNEIIEQDCSVSTDTTYNYDLIKVNLDNYSESLYQKAMNLISNGGNTVIVVNTVHRAIELYMYIKDRIQTSKENIELGLLHSRFTLNQKNKKTKELLNKYGKDRTNRPIKSIFISTQIIEQSLDVDFDFMITEIAPIDLLIQRFGRARRHSDKGTIRELRMTETPYIYIFAWDNGFDKSGYVYDKSILDATLLELQSQNAIHVPGDIRELIANVYSTNNVNQLRNLQMKEEAELNIIGNVDSNLWRHQNRYSLNKHTHTRLEGILSTNIILLNQEQISRLGKGIPFTVEEQKNIIKNQMYSSVPLAKIEERQCLYCKDCFDDYKIFSEIEFNISEELGLCYDT